jgi:hypothetical protein
MNIYTYHEYSCGILVEIVLYLSVEINKFVAVCIGLKTRIFARKLSILHSLKYNIYFPQIYTIP